MLSAQVDNMTFLQADKRIAQFLVNLAGKPGAEQTINCTHEEIGNLVGTSRVTVSKILSAFVNRGWISTQYHNILILNLKALTEFAFNQE
jgi:CRP-like cAMP-binding protein